MKTETWQFKIVKYLAYAEVLLIPLYFNTKHWAPFAAPKTLLMIGGGILMALFFIWGWAAEKEKKTFSFTWMHGVLLAYLGVLTISAIAGTDPSNSFFATFDQPVSLVMLYSLGIFAFMVGFLAKRDETFVRKILTISFIGGVIVAIISYTGDSILHFSREGSTLGNDSYLGAYLLYISCFGIWIFFSLKKYWQKIVTGIGLLLIFFCPAFFNSGIFKGTVSLSDAFHHPQLFVGSAMGAVVGLGLALVIALLLRMIRAKRKTISISGFLIFVVLVSSLFFAWHELMTPGTSLRETYIAQKSANRFMFWDIANQGYLEHPLLGYGLGNYFKIYQNHFSSAVYRKDHALELWISQPHNIALEYLSTTGILGLLAYLALLGYMLVYFFRQSSEREGKVNILPILIFGALLGEFIQNLFIFDTPVTYLIFFLVIGMAIVESKPLFHFKFPASDVMVKRSIAGVMTIAAIWGLVVLVIHPWEESKKLKRLTDVKNFNTIPSLLHGIQETSVMGNIRDTAFFTDTYLGLLEKVTDKITDTNKKNVLDVTRNVVDNLEGELVGRPDNFRGNLVAGELLSLYSIIDKKSDQKVTDEARKYLEIAHAISPEHVLPYLALAQSRLIEHDIRGARAYTRAALAIAPEYGATYKFAEEINSIVPDTTFMNYVKEMQKRWDPMNTDEVIKRL